MGLGSTLIYTKELILCSTIEIQFGSTVARHWHDFVSNVEPWSSLIYSLGVYIRDQPRSQGPGNEVDKRRYYEPVIYIETTSTAPLGVYVRFSTILMTRFGLGNTFIRK